MVDIERQTREYEQALGSEERRRQEQLAIDRLPCCGEHKDDGHHEACSKRPAVETPAIHPNQDCLL